MESFSSVPLIINVSRSGSGTFMSWTGQSTDKFPSRKLMPYLDNLVSELKGHMLTISFAGLEYMNSSTVPPIIQFIKKLDAFGIRTLITYNSSSKWQSASFRAFETLSLMMKNITVKGE